MSYNGCTGQNACVKLEFAVLQIVNSDVPIKTATNNMKKSR